MHNSSSSLALARSLSVSLLLALSPSLTLRASVPAMAQGCLPLALSLVRLFVEFVLSAMRFWRHFKFECLSSYEAGVGGSCLG